MFDLRRTLEGCSDVRVYVHLDVLNDFVTRVSAGRRAMRYLNCSRAAMSSRQCNAMRERSPEYRDIEWSGKSRRNVTQRFVGTGAGRSHELHYVFTFEFIFSFFFKLLKKHHYWAGVGLLWLRLVVIVQQAAVCVSSDLTPVALYLFALF